MRGLLGALRCQRFEDLLGVGRVRSIIEGENHFALLQKRRRRVLVAEQSAARGIDLRNARDAEGIGTFRKIVFAAYGGRGHHHD